MVRTQILLHNILFVYRTFHNVRKFHRSTSDVLQDPLSKVVRVEAEKGFLSKYLTLPSSVPSDLKFTKGVRQVSIRGRDRQI